MRRPLVVVGDALLDRDLAGAASRLAPDAPVPVIDDPTERSRPGGAALAATLAAGDGHEVVLVTAIGPDQAGATLADLLAAAGVELVDLGLAGPTPQKVRVRAAGQSLARLDFGGGGSPNGPLTPAAEAALAGAGAVLVSDYGRGLVASVSTAVAACGRQRPLVWDPHPRGSEPVPGARVVTPNRAEARHFATAGDAMTAGKSVDDSLAAVTARARALVRRWAAVAVAVTMGDRGALLVGADGTPLAVPAAKVNGGDPCGAGDRFASAVAEALGEGALPSEAVPFAVAAATAFVGAGGAATWPHGAPAAGDNRPVRPAAEVIAATRARGGVVVATGGCFDLLHAGHVATLTAARALGDCLVVCLNSDASVRRLKGPERPLVPATDRAAVLGGLACVDAVAVFDEDTPETLLSVLRPDVWAKGADYAAHDLPEARLVESWGGSAVVLPYLPGRSTTRLVQTATGRSPSTVTDPQVKDHG